MVTVCLQLLLSGAGSQFWLWDVSESCVISRLVVSVSLFPPLNRFEHLRLQMHCGFETFLEQITLVPKADAISASRVQRTPVIF